MMRSTILFDFDGVIVNSDRFNLVTLGQAAGQIGLEFSSEVFMRHFSGRSLRYGAGCWLAGLKRLHLLNELIERKIEQDDRYVDLVDVFPATAEFILKHSRDFSMGLITGSRSRLVDLFLSAYPEFNSCFDCVVTVEDVSRDKPAPDPYFQGLELLNATPNETLAIEDSPAGIDSANRAGLKTIAVSQTHSSDLLCEAALVVTDLSELSGQRLMCLG